MVLSLFMESMIMIALRLSEGREQSNLTRWTIKTVQKRYNRQKGGMCAIFVSS